MERGREEGPAAAYRPVWPHDDDEDTAASWECWPRETWETWERAGNGRETGGQIFINDTGEPRWWLPPLGVQNSL